MHDSLKILGSWCTDPKDQWSLREYGKVSLDFSENGALVYTIHLPDKDQIMRLSYRLEGNTLVTDQPSSPREERTEFFFASDGRLALSNVAPNPPTFYIRMNT